jgi:hypothetical protein
MTRRPCDFAHLTDEAIAQWLLARDPLFARVAPADAGSYAASALEHGRVRAGLARSKWGRDAQHIAAAMGVRVIECRSQAGFGSTLVFAEYCPRPLRIVLYSRAIARMNERLRADELGALLGIDDCTSVFLAHELYHHLERLDAKRSLHRKHRVTLLRFGPWQWTSGLMSLDEIAAGAFAQTLLGLRRHPALLDVICVADAQGANQIGSDNTVREAA